MLSINTNLSSLTAQKSLNNSTQLLNKAIEQMTTGYKINHASDNSANFSISTNMEIKLSSYQVAEDNVAMGLDLIATASDTLDLVSNHLTRIRDLYEQALNGTYGEDSLKAIQSEMIARGDEIYRILRSSEYNGIGLFSYFTDGLVGLLKPPITLQVGIDSSDNSTISFKTELDSGCVACLNRVIYSLKIVDDSQTGPSMLDPDNNLSIHVDPIVLEQIDIVLSGLSSKQTELGSVQNRLESALDEISTHYENLTSSHSTLKDADIAKVSSEYIRQQILQQASATLLSTANQTPSIALQLI